MITLLQIFCFGLLISALACTAVYSQDTSSIPVTRTDSLLLGQQTESTFSWHSMVTDVPRDLGQAGGFSFSLRNAPVLLGLGGITAALLVSDQKTYAGARHAYERSPFVHSASDLFVELGDGRSQLVLAGALAAYGIAASDHRAIRTGSQIVEAVLGCGLTVQLLKRVAGRESPAAASSPSGRWRPFPSFKEYHLHQTKYFAFPSGHTATAMATVTVLAENYPEVRWVRPVGYGVVSLIGLSLVNRSYHWYSDLPLGMAVGYLFGQIVSTSGEPPVEGYSEPQPSTLRITPLVLENGGGVTVVVIL